MNYADAVISFYEKFTHRAKITGKTMNGPCPFCPHYRGKKRGMLIADIDPESFFLGYFRCSERCTPGGFPLHYAALKGLDPKTAPGYDPDRRYHVPHVNYPPGTLNAEMKGYMDLMDAKRYDWFKEFGVSKRIVDEMRIGYNGRYLVYPYYLENGNCYAARCVVPDREEQSFWHGNKDFFTKEFRIYNVREIDRCENGALFITDSENHLLTLRELGYPGIAVCSITDLEALNRKRFAHIRNVFIGVSNSPDARHQVHALASDLGYKVRILKWPFHKERGYGLVHLAKEKGKDFRIAVASMVDEAKAFSPFSPPEKEERQFFEFLEEEKDRDILGLGTGFPKFDRALNGIRGINIMGGQPKAGKSCFFMQISTEMAARKIPVIYYDFENGRRKIYSRTLCRLGKLSERDIRSADPDEKVGPRMKRAKAIFGSMLRYFRVVTERRLNPDIMRRQIDFLRHETRQDQVLVVIDSLHKLPFKELSSRRTGIDSWLRQMEAIRDEQNAAFLVVSELSRGAGDKYEDKPDMGSFKGSGDIEYSADNAMIFVPDWNALDPITTKKRKSTLWMVASRENSPGKIATYLLEYPFWGFREIDERRPRLVHSSS